MAIKKSSAGVDVASFLDGINHPLRKEIDSLRRIILSVDPALSENIKWNGPNFTHDGQDRITMRIHPPTQIQLVFHRGAEVKEQPPGHLIEDPSGMLVWKANDRAVATFRSGMEVTKRKIALTRLVHAWIEASNT